MLSKRSLLPGALLVTSAALLSGCGVKQAAVLTTELANLNLDYAGLEATPSRALPPGSANYEGIAVVGVQADALSGAALMGDAELTVDFELGTARGTITDFVGLPVDNAIESVGTILINPAALLADLRRASGDVTLTETSLMDGAIEATLAGDVTMANVVYGFGGTVAGEAIGDDGEAIRLEADEETLVMTVDGEDAQGGLFEMLVGQVTP